MEDRDRSSQSLVRFLPVIILILVLVAASFHRVGLYQNRIGYDSRSDFGFFFTEEAFQYRYARMIAENEPVPEHDRKAQWPEGLYPRQELTLLQEYLHGLSFRLFTGLFPEVSFHVYVICFVSIFSTLAVAALFFGARILGADAWTALLAAALYAFTGAAFGRVRFYELEATAFPLMAWSFVLMLYGFKAESARYRIPAAVAAGLLLAASLNTWHFTRFYWLAITAACGLAFLVAGGNRQRFQVFGIMFGFVTATGLISPVMRTAGLMTSPAVIIGGVLLAALYLDGRRPLSVRYRAALLAAGPVLALLIVPAGGEGGAYGHVWALLKYKLANFLIKPEDPTGLPLAARIMWHGPFNTIEPLFLIYRYGLLLPLGLLGGLKLWGRARQVRDFNSFFLLITATAFFALNIMTRRLTIFGAFFLGLLMALLFSGAGGQNPAGPAAGYQPAWPPPASVRRRLMAGFILAACLIFQVNEARRLDQTRFLSLLERFFPPRQQALLFKHHHDELNMLKWVQQYTEAGAVFLSNQENSPSLLTWADRAIVLHPKFETEKARNKYIHSLLTLYGDDEEAFYNLLREYQVDYYLYPVMNLLLVGPDSERYRAGLSRLPRGSLIYRLHFDPHGFSGLRPVYRNGFYQIYQVTGTAEIKPEVQLPYYPVYDEGLFRPVSVSGGDDDDYFDDRRAEHVLWRIRHAWDMVERAEQLAAGDNRKETPAFLREAVETGLPDGSVYYRAADAALTVNIPRLALKLMRQALSYDPGNTEFQKMMAGIYLMTDDPEAALPLLTDLRRTTPDDPVVYNYLGIFFWQKKQYEQSRKYFKRALELDPAYETVEKNLLLLEGKRF